MAKIVSFFEKFIKLLTTKLKDFDEIKEREYPLGKYKIVLNDNHVLDKYQQLFPLYNRFLPVLCAGFDGLIIDIGANIGDTSISIFSENSKSFIVGVEPDDIFYAQCINNIQQNDLTDRFLGVKKFISTNKGKYSIEKSDTLSTGSISVDTNQSVEINTISFIELIDLIPTEKSVKFDILKIDTDGFDWDIIDSFVEYNKNLSINPRFIFFEMQTYLNNGGVKDKNRREIIGKYKLSIEKLQIMGYNNFCLFDNFGTPIKITQSITEIFEINNYIIRSQIYNSHSTIYYLDILAFSNIELKHVNEALVNLYKK